MTNTENWEKEYESGTTQECPHCGKDMPEHSCRDCYSDIGKETCWKLDGYCQKCFDFIHEEIPKIEAEKERLGVKCKCVNVQCAKCLSINCQDKSCPVHTKEHKETWRRRWEEANKKPFPYPKNY